MHTRFILRTVSLWIAILFACTSMAVEVETPRIDCVVPLPEQPQAKAPATIWYDDFNGQPRAYAEGGTSLDDAMSFGLTGGSLRCLYEQGQRGTGGCKVFFGDSPSYPQKAVRRGETFDDWNSGSPVTQSRWYDNFVISTEPIGPVVCPANPTVIKTPYRGSGRAGAWQVEVASDYNGREVVYQSRLLPPVNSVVIDPLHGTFVGPLAGQQKFSSGGIYYLRVRQQNAEGITSDWSRWHQGFKVEGLAQ